MKSVLKNILDAYDVEVPTIKEMGEAKRLERAVALKEQDAIGQPGTTVHTGHIESEPTPAYGPTYVRGTAGNAGIYEEHYRSEPLIIDAVQSHTEVLAQGRVELQAPSEMPDDDAARERIEGFVDFHNAKLQTLIGAYIENAAAALVFGFVPFCNIWGTTDAGRVYLHDMMYYEPSTVDSWEFDEKMQGLVAANFKATGDGPDEWRVPAVGAKITDRRLSVVALNARGNNVEGISPLRSSIFYVKAKQLLLQIAMVSAEKYGVPVVAVEEELPQPGVAPSAVTDGDMNTVYQALRYQRAVGAHVLKLKAGMRLGFYSPGGTMPTYADLIAYCDQMIATPFSVEGSLLGLQQAVGSYALGEVKERDALRSAPYYARKLLEPINTIMRELAIEELGEMREYPRAVWRMDTATDDGAWLERATATFGGSIDTWPKAAQKVGLEMLDLPPDTFDHTDEQAPPSLPSLGMSECGHDHVTLSDREATPIEMAETDELERIMDAVEASLAAELTTIQRDMQSDWRVMIRDNTTSQDLLADRRALRDRYEPIMLAAVTRAMQDAAEQAGNAYIGGLGADASYTLDVDGEIAMLAVATADEALGRIIGVMTQGEVERERGGRRRTVATLGAVAIANIAARVTSSAINRARDGVVQGLVDAARDKGATIKRVIATRSAVLDSNTCSECRKLDGRKATVGTAAYRALTPPNSCLGHERCRCVWMYDLPYDALAKAGVIDDQIAAERAALRSIEEGV